MRRVGLPVIILALAVHAGAWLQAQQPSAGRAQGPAPAAVRPALLFKEEWRMTPHEGAGTDENLRFTPAVVTSPNVAATLYGRDAKVIRTAEHEGRVDLWNGLATSPVAVTLKDKRNFADLTGLARLRWMVRTNSIHTLYPVLKLADGSWIAGNRGISTDGEFLEVEVAFSGMRWFRFDPATVVVTSEVKSPALDRVDEVGLAALAPGGGHGVAASFNLSTVELFARPVPR